MLTHDTPTQPGVEAWRGLAAWLVVYAHFWSFGGSDWLPMRFAHTGVDLFFVLSGFVFAPYLWGKPLSAPAFALRRFFRIYPAYMLALAVYVAMKLQAGHAPQYLWQHLSFMQVQSREMAFYYNPPFWSLPAEVEFYVLLPLLAWGLRRLPHWGFVAVLLLSAAWRVWLGAQGDIDQQDAAYILQFHLPGVGVEFLLGALAWRLGRRGLPAALRWALVLAGLALWWALAVWFGQVGDAGVNAGCLKGQMGWLAALCFALMVAGSLARPRLQDTSPALQHSLWQRLALRMGQLSYGVYLFHIAALQLAAHWQSQLTGFPLGHQGLAVLLTLLMAWVCHALWEEPWRRWGRRQADRLQAKLLQSPTAAPSSS